MLIYISGSGHHKVSYFVQKYSMQKLYSALNEKKLIEKYPRNCELMVDSGAHSWNKFSMGAGVGGATSKALPNVRAWGNEYAQWVLGQDFESRIIIELDVYAVLDKDILDGLYADLVRTLKHARLMRVYHQVLDGGTLKVLKQWIDEGQTIIGLSRSTEKLWGKIFALTRQQVRYHGFAVNSYNTLAQYPFYSVDSSTAIAPIRYGGGMVNGAYQSKAQLIKRRDPSIALTSPGRAERAVKQMKQLQQQVTTLWRHRGVSWE